MSKHEDQETIWRVLGGDMNAYEEIVKTYERQVVGVAHSVLGDHAASEDVAQEGFVRAFRNLKRFDPGKGSFRTWLLAIARNLALNAKEKKRPVPVADVPEAAEEERAVEGREAFGILDEALRSEPEELRRVFEMVVLEGIDVSAVASIEGIAEATVRTRVSRVRGRLREALESRCGKGLELS